MKINIGKWLRRQVFGGEPVTINNMYDLVAAIRSDPALRESLAAKVKREILLGLDLERVLALLDQHEAELVDALPGGVIAIRMALGDIRDWAHRAQTAVTDWQL